ncbi:beta-1,4-mannosyltransferase [Quadrisphaera granulorum]|uniref:Beta-1,4-mannosyltransferase n=1 Tax=Quadrisphaera granulorum TaxID=317664 RepID=A0A315ZTY6_9ACTN|nr:GDP-mannose--glycolipid 4-beta-D-mannosyltransferase [Quadrisphaera granulorum]PWJ48643.1 beta-1,4-mannosyltransferase [Quadrisphaera granulorum]SZE98365.1 beta-1,4-mannosyltransferase [Quadrisphaera granulorum]
MSTAPTTSASTTGTPTGAATPTVRVLHSLAPPDGTTKYVDQITQMAPPGVDVGYFSWRTALTGRYDVLHLHWPELLLRARTPRKRLAKRAAMLALLLRTRITRTPIVRTVHNPRPHEAGSWAERRLLAAVDASTSLFIRLNATTTVAPGKRVETILHGHYRDRFAQHPRSEAVPGRLVYAGIIRPYKGVDRLLELAPHLAPHGVSTRVVGSPSDDMRSLVEKAVHDEPSVSARLAFVPDADLVTEVTAGELVVLPYRELHNSGALLVALSLDRPVLVPRTPSTESLRDEVGADWLHLYDGELQVDHVLAAFAAARQRQPGDRPRLEGRDWDHIGRAHAAAYAAVLATGRRS